MSEQRPSEPWEERLRDEARRLPYPDTPDIAGAVRRRLADRPAPRHGGRPRLRLALLVAVLLAGGLLSVPEVRATLRRLLRIGSVTVEVVTPTPTSATPGCVAEPCATSTPPPPPTARATAGPGPLTEQLRLTGETTLEDAAARVSFPIRLPAYPPGLGRPDGVFVQDLMGPALVLIWLDPQNSEAVSLSLHTLTSADLAYKKIVDQDLISETLVHGREALWIDGLHILEYYRRDGVADWDGRRLVEGRVLIWTEGGLTYRLESGLSMAEAVRVAESLREDEASP